MAKALTVEQLRTALRSPKGGQADPFALLKAVAAFVNVNENGEVGREMVLRALDQQEFFAGCDQILDSLARAVGLFPYMDADSLDLRDAIAYEFHRPLNMPPELVFHREQARVYQRLLAGDSVVLSAPTSFGKSKIIDALIASQKYENIALIVPTLALIDETRRRLSVFSERYKIVTHVSQAPARRNIFVFTAERAVAYEHVLPVDFFVIDEFYKIDPGTRDDTRAVALSQTFYKLRKTGAQFYLLGPNVERVPADVESVYGCHFYPTNYSTVVSEQSRVKGAGTHEERLIDLLKRLEEPTLVFCSSPPRVNAVAAAMLNAGIGVPSRSLASCADWAAKTHHPDWTFCRAIVQGIGIHHGRLPRSLAQYIVRMFNEQKIRFLVCTSTLIEGVNTKAKNVVIYDNTIANQKLDYFTFNNIKGRSGRMGQHFVGHVYLFHDPPHPTLPYVDFQMLTQPMSAPTSLLVQLDESDLKPESQERVQEYLDEDDLPLEVVRQNSGVKPEYQVELAQHIRKNARTLFPYLQWTNNPNGRQFQRVCDLIWTFLVRSKRHHGVSSGKQLSFKTFQLMDDHSVFNRVLKELTNGKYAAKTVDEAVERVLEFDRHWATFELPRDLMTVSRIQAHVLGDLGLPFGDYRAFAGRIECMFTNPVVGALDEYGIPMQLGERMSGIFRTTDNLDVALQNLGRVNTSTLRGVTDFERELIEDAKEFL